jgi:hypothetical protein
MFMKVAKYQEKKNLFLAVVLTLLVFGLGTQMVNASDKYGGSGGGDGGTMTVGVSTVTFSVQRGDTTYVDTYDFSSGSYTSNAYTSDDDPYTGSGTLPVGSTAPYVVTPATAADGCWVTTQKTWTTPCSTICDGAGGVQARTPAGAACMSGEARSREAIAEIGPYFPWGTWGGPDGNTDSTSVVQYPPTYRDCGRTDGGDCRQSDPGGWSPGIVACYMPGQKRDIDRTDLVTACYCANLPVANCTNPAAVTPDPLIIAPTVRLLISQNGGTPTANDVVASPGSDYTLSWTGTAGSATETCDLTSDAGYSDTDVGLNDVGYPIATPAPGTTVVYSIDCTSADGSAGDALSLEIATPNSVTASLQVALAGSAPQPVGANIDIDPGEQVELTWNSSGSGFCYAHVGDLAGFSTGAEPAGIDTTVAEPAPGTSQIFEIECTGPGGTDRSAVTVTTNPLIDITIAALSFIPSAINSGGYYSSVSFLADVLGIPVGTDDVPYTLTFGASTTSGTIEQTMAGPVFSNPLVFTNVPFTLTDDAVLEVDLPEPGVVGEDLGSTPQNEDIEGNTLTRSVNLPTPDPIISITGPDVVRSGEPAEITWSVSALYPVACTFQGPGFNRTFIVNGALGLPAQEGDTEFSDDLFNTGRFVISCTAGSNVYTDAFIVEVIPTFQEI